MKYKPHLLKRDVITRRTIDNKMTMLEVAKAVGVCDRVICRIENEKMITIETLGKICSWLGTKPNDYFEIKDNNKKEPLIF